MTTNRDATDRERAPEDAERPDSGRKPFLRLPSRLALTGIRTRILLGFIVMLAIATTASVVVAREVLQARLHERIDDDVAQEARELRRIATGRDPATGRPFGQNVRRIFRVYFNQNAVSRGEVVLTFVDGSPFLRSRSLSTSYRLDRDAGLVSRWARLEEPERGDVDTPAGRVEYLAVPLKSDGAVLGTFVVAQFTDVLQRPYDEALIATGVVGLAILLIGSLLAWFMAETVLRPLRSMAHAAHGISSSDLTQRIEVRGHDELAELALTFNEMLDRLEHAFAGQRRFLDDAGHELRTPITIISGNLELLEDEPDERAATLAIVMDELDRMSRMVDELLLLAKAEQPDFLRPGAVDVAELTDELMAKATTLAPRTWTLEARGQGVVIADRQRLTQALMQLASNAADHTREGDVVALGSAVMDGEARLWVRDEGPGIAPDDQKAIFERFERRGGKKRTGGAGLGLSIVRAIAAAHGGRVELLSGLGAGALFTIVVPVEGPPHSGEVAT